MELILERDGSKCVWCRRDVEVGQVFVTTEHLIPKAKGGPSWVENEVAACRRCNGKRGHQTIGQWLQFCARQGWQPDLVFLIARLEALQAVIEERGGQRRARVRIAAALRRLEKEIRMPGFVGAAHLEDKS